MTRLALLLTLFVFCFGCADPERHEPVASAPPASNGRATLDQWVNQGQAAPARPASGPAAVHGEPARPAAAAPGGGGQYAGNVTETMDSGGYTYMNVNTPNGPVWVATAQREMAVGTHVSASGMVMRDFHSSTLDRTFPQLVLASTVEVTDAP